MIIKWAAGGVIIGVVIAMNSRDNAVNVSIQCSIMGTLRVNGSSETSVCKG